MFKNLDKIIAEVTPLVTTWRRNIHQYPELGLEEHQTAAFICEKLAECGITYQKIGHTGVTAVLQGASDMTIALRADMDALPIIEATGLPYASKNQGVMHACGHDAHTAIVMAVAYVLSKVDNLPGNVKFIFQPCEERLPGGANMLIDAGVLENPKVEAVIGLHMYPDLPVGTIGIKPGAIMAATDTFTVEVEGKGGHGAAPHTSIDPIVSAAQMINALQTLVSRRVNPVEPAVVTIGTIHAGERPNIIPEKCIFSGTVRSISTETRRLLHHELQRVINAIADATGTVVTINYEFGHGPLLNDEELTKFTAKTLKTAFTENTLHMLNNPSMGGEDFASFAERVPSVYMFFGAAPENDVYPWHHPKFDIDEEVLPFAVKALVTLILAYLISKN